jgi:hypothetical protein
VFVDAGGAERAAACADGDFAALEVAEELLPFLVGGDAVFFARAKGPAAGQEGHVRLNRLFGIDGLVAERDVDVLVACDHLGDVRRQSVEDRVGDEQPTEVVRCVAEWGAGDVRKAGVDEGLVEHGADGFIGERAVLAADAPLEQQRGRLLPCAFAAVVGADQGNGAGGVPDSADDRAQDVGEFGTDQQ